MTISTTLLFNRAVSLMGRQQTALAELQEKGYQFRGLIEAIAISEPFLKREGKGKP